MKQPFKYMFIMIAVYAVVYGCATSPQPPSHEPVPDHRAGRPQSRGKELGKAFLAEALRQYRFIKDPEVTSLVTHIGRKIIAAQNNDPSTFHFFVVKETSPNAFAIPGGYIFIFDSLVEKFRDPSELTGVLAHEIAHVERNHFFKDEKKILVTDLAAIAAILLSRGNPATVAMAQAANIDLQLHYSRANESEADTYAVEYLRAAGYDPKGLLRSFETLSFYKQFNVPDAPIYFSTHPGLEVRKTHLELLLQDENPYPSQDESVDWLRIVVGLRAQRLSVNDVPALVQGLTDPEYPERRHYLTGVAYLKSSHFNKAIPHYEEALKLNPEASIYYADLALCYLHSQKMDLAKSKAQESLKRDPDQALALIVLGRLEAYEGRFNEAVVFYKKALQRYSVDPLLHLYLAQSYKQLGHDALHAYHLGRFLRLDLKPRQAIHEFERAKTLLEDESELLRKVSQEITQIRRDGV